MSSEQRAQVSPRLIDQIIDWGIRAIPEEACGLILPDNRVVPIDNVSETPTTRYTLHQIELIEVLTEYAEQHNDELDLDGFIVWHTHPSGYVGPSEGDLREAVEGLRYLVVTIPSGEAVEFTSEG